MQFYKGMSCEIYSASWSISSGDSHTWFFFIIYFINLLINWLIDYLIDWIIDWLSEKCSTPFPQQHKVLPTSLRILKGHFLT